MLGRLGKILRIVGYKVYRDSYRHIVVSLNDETFVSVYCSGFRPEYDVQKLTRLGEVDRRFQERKYRSRYGVLGYINRLNQVRPKVKLGG